MTTSKPTLRVLSFNVKKVDEVEPVRDWEPIASLITSYQPDVVLLQELDGTSGKPRGENGRPLPGAAVDTRQADRLGAALGMHVRIADSPSTVHTAIAWRPELELVHWEELVAPLLHHGQSLAVLKHPRWAQPISFLGVHFNPFSVPAAVIEAQHVVAHLRRHGPWAILGGDVNTPPLGDRPPPWEELPPHNVASRAVPGPGPLRPHLEVGYALANADLVDVAAYLADQRQDPALRQATGKGRVRVDQFHLTPALARGLMDYLLLDSGGLSDHQPILTELSLPAKA